MSKEDIIVELTSLADILGSDLGTINSTKIKFKLKFYAILKFTRP